MPLTTPARHARTALAAALLLGHATQSGAQTTVNCTPQQITTIADAQSLIAGKVDGALIHVGQTPHFERWFGTYDAGRAATVTSNLGMIRGYAMISQPEYTCIGAGQGSCTPGTLAYVAAGSSFEISLFPDFFSLGPVGTDTTWGTILHEMTHFAMGPATGDECYGSVGVGSCLDLAIRNPAAAVTNADSYQYFVERAPF
ncbi:hypothetical protein LA6_003950 [Marinibacterium anthonyi]|nr:hypothetical protein LA6_003950 [Marinibacterium anthonyi]